MAQFNAYIICTSPRSGSTLLCSLLRSSGVAGYPESWFHQASITSWIEALNVNIDASAPQHALLEAIFKAAIAHGRRDTDIFALRLQRHSFDFFQRTLCRLHPGLNSDSARLNRAFGHSAMIYLQRRDKIAQAVSCLIAEQTGLWHRAADGSELERLSPPAEAVYSGAQIAACVARMLQWDRQWQNWFRSENIMPLTLDYCSLATEPGRTLQRVLDYLRLDSDAAALATPGVAKLADHTNQLWIERFCREFPTLADSARMDSKWPPR